MRLLLLSLTAFATNAHASTNCTILRETRDGVYDKEVYSVDLDVGQSQLAYIKPNGRVIALTADQVRTKKSFRDLQGSKFFTISVRDGQLLIGHGDVNIHRRPVRRLESWITVKAAPATYWTDAHVVSCV